MKKARKIRKYFKRKSFKASREQNFRAVLRLLLKKNNIAYACLKG